MTAAFPRPCRLTRQQYFRLGELGFFEGRRVERIRGVIQEMSPIGWSHSLACHNIRTALARFFTGHGVVALSELSLALSESDPQPDVVVLAGQLSGYHTHPTTALLVVEVSDTTLQNDLMTKDQLYAEAAIQDYWVLDLEHRELHVFRDPGPLAASLDAMAHRKHTVLKSDETVSPLARSSESVRLAELLPS